MSGFFQRLFGKDNKPAIARGPLGLHLNSGFTLDTLAFRLLEDELLIALPGDVISGAVRFANDRIRLIIAAARSAWFDTLLKAWVQVKTKN